MSMLSSFLFFSLIVSDFARRSNLPQGHKHVILLSCRSSVMLAIFRFMVYCELFLTSEIVRVWDWFSFLYRHPGFPDLLLEKMLLLLLNYLSDFHKNRVSAWSYFHIPYSAPLIYFFLTLIHNTVITLALNQLLWDTPLCLKTLLAILGYLHFKITFKINVSISMKKLADLRVRVCWIILREKRQRYWVFPCM